MFLPSPTQHFLHEGQPHAEVTAVVDQLQLRQAGVHVVQVLHTCQGWNTSWFWQQLSGEGGHGRQQSEVTDVGEL